ELFGSFELVVIPVNWVFFAGTVWAATAHIVTAVIGSGVLALAWSVAQLGWVAGPLALAGEGTGTDLDRVDMSR
ncbi:Os12g0203300, partial [Oryza sativa Japonica Group]